MAGGKLDSRQKMINMMYLVFIAMLALNISKEVLATLGLINSDIAAATQDLVADSNEKYTLFSNNANNEYYRIAAQSTPEIQIIADEYFNYIDTLKQRLMNTSETSYKIAREDKKTGEIDSIIDYQTMDKSQYLDELFFTGDQYSENGQEFVDRFSSFPAKLQTVLDVFVAADLEKDPPSEDDPDGQYIDFDFSFLGELNKRFAYTEMVLNRDGKYQPYLNYHFEGFPLIASLSKLTKIQSDIRFIENKILEYIISVINEHEGGISANTYQTLLESSKSSFYTGDLVDASVVMGKKDSNFIPSSVELFINDQRMVKGKDFTIAGGGVQLNKRFGAPGSYKVTGKLFFERNKIEQSVDVAQIISVINKPNDAIISVDKLKALYVGLDNVLSISIPGVNDNTSLVVSCPSSHGKIKRKGNKWLAVPDSTRVNEKFVINVSGKINGSPVRMKPQQFDVKPLPLALGSIKIKGIEGSISNGRLPINLIKNGVITAAFPKDFFYKVDIDISGFSIQIGNSPSISISSNRISNSNAVPVLENARRGDLVYISNIQANITSDGKKLPIPNVSPLVLTIN